MNQNFFKFLKITLFASLFCSNAYATKLTPEQIKEIKTFADTLKELSVDIPTAPAEGFRKKGKDTDDPVFQRKIEAFDKKYNSFIQGFPSEIKKIINLCGTAGATECNKRCGVLNTAVTSSNNNWSLLVLNASYSLTITTCQASLETLVNANMPAETPKTATTAAAGTKTPRTPFTIFKAKPKVK